MSCCGKPVALASLVSFELGNSQWTVLFQDPSVDLTPADLQVISTSSLQSFRVFIKCAKTDPFQCGCFICLVGCFSLVSELTSYLHLHGPGISPLFIFQDGRPLLRPFYLWFCNPPYRQLAFLQSSQVIALESVLQLPLLREVFLTTSLRQRVAGWVKFIFFVHTHGCHPFSSW